MNSQTWQLQDAKNKFSSLVEMAHNIGPQIVTKHGEEVVVILDIVEYQKLITPKTSLLNFFKKSPFKNVELDLERTEEGSREVEL